MSACDHLRACSRGAMIAAVVLTAGGCESTFPGGAVPTGDDAVRLADRECARVLRRFPQAWHAVLMDGAWHAWKKGGLRVTIDARTGVTSGCEMNGQPLRRINGDEP